MPITIHVGWWILPFLVSLTGSFLIIRDDLRNGGGTDWFGIGAAFTFMGHAISWGIPWGIYGVCRAIFG